MASAQRGNGYDPKLTSIFVDDIERHVLDLDRIAAERMAESKCVRETIAEIYDRAKDAGLPKATLKAVIKARALERKAKAAREALDEDRRESFDQIRLALGDLADLPLGAAALKDKEPNPVDSLAGDDEFDAIGQTNAKKIEDGIKPLPN